MRRYIVGSILGGLLALTLSGTALAHDCFVAKKPAGAGSVGIASGESFTPGKHNPGTQEQSHGGFVTVDLGGGQTVDVFTHQYLPPIREGGPQANCDGRGLDAASVCYPQ